MEKLYAKMDFIQWANESKTVLYVQAPQTISDHDASTVLVTIRMMCDSVDHPVNLVVDRRKTIKGPRKMMVSMRDVIAKQNFQHVVFIGFAMLPKMLVETLAKLPGVFTSDPIFAANLDEAFEKLDISDSILEDTPQT